MYLWSKSNLIELYLNLNLSVLIQYNIIYFYLLVNKSIQRKDNANNNNKKLSGTEKL